MKQKNAVILGASGLVGSLLAKELSQCGLYSRITLIVRKKPEAEIPGTGAALVNFASLQDNSDLFRADDIFCALGTTIKKAGSREQFRKVDYEYPLAAATLALAQGGTRFFLVSAIGADADSKVFYNRVKGELENAVKKLGFRAVHIFQPSMLDGTRSEPRPGEQIGLKVMKTLDFVFAGPLKKYKPIHAQTVARAMARAANLDQAGIYVYPSDEIEKMGKQD